MNLRDLINENEDAYDAHMEDVHRRRIAIRAASEGMSSKEYIEELKSWEEANSGNSGNS